MPTPALTAHCRHVKDLADHELNELLDIHLFRNDRWCYGVSRQVHRSFDYRCEICKAIDEGASYARAIFGGPHLRRVPEYSIESILEGMMGHTNKSTQTAFARAVMAAVNANASPHVRRPYSDWLRLFAVMTPRLLSVAALQALGIIDEAGFLNAAPDREEVVL